MQREVFGPVWLLANCSGGAFESAMFPFWDIVGRDVQLRLSP